MGQSLFAPDIEASLLSAAALLNTLPGASHSGRDELDSAAALTAYLDTWAYTAPRTGDADELDRVRESRGALRELLTTEGDARAEVVNRVLREHDALPQLVRHDGWDWHFHADRPGHDVATWILVETAMAVADLVRTGETGRLGVCAASDCDAVFVDLSRNRSKRFCDVGNCANRAHVAAFRARRAAD